MTTAETIEYLRGLQPGEEVVEIREEMFNYDMKGVIYISENGQAKGSTCVKWADGMGTAVTWGTRRLSDRNKV